MHTSAAQLPATGWWRVGVRMASVAVVGLLGAVGAFATATAAPVTELPAQADESTLSWSVRPTPTDDAPDRPNFAFELDPGVSIADGIRVRNYTTEPLQLDIYASDAVTTSSGALDLLPAGEQPTDVGVWIELETNEIVVAAQSSVDVPFTLTVPDDAEPGDHSGGIVTSFRASSTDDSGEPVVLDRRLGSRVHVRVGGDLRPELAISEVTTSYSGTPNPIGTGTVGVSYTVTNTGNVRVGAEQAIVIPGRFGFPGRRVEGEAMGELLPGNSLTFTADVEEVWPTVRTGVEIELALIPIREGDVFDATTPITASTALWTVPWSQLAVLVVLVAIPLLRRRQRRRRQRREAALVQKAVDEALAGQPDEDPARTRPTVDADADAGASGTAPGVPATAPGAPSAPAAD